jgi:hypothetical protein
MPQTAAGSALPESCMVYLPLTKKMEAEPLAGKIVLSGCVLTMLDAPWQYVGCDAEIYRQKDVEGYKFLFEEE